VTALRPTRPEHTKRKGLHQTQADSVREAAALLPLELHSYIVAPLIAEGTALGIVSVVRDQTPESFTNDDVEFVKCASAQIAVAIVRARART